MAGFTPFTSNYTDLSDENGYQFEFRCDHLRVGLPERVHPVQRRHGRQHPRAAPAASSAASSAAPPTRRTGSRTSRTAARATTRSRRPPTRSCPCSPAARGATAGWTRPAGTRPAGCASRDAPKLAAEMEAERAQVEINQMREAMAQRDGVLGRHVRPAAPSAPTAASPSARRSSARTAAARRARTSAPSAAPSCRPARASAGTAARRPASAGLAGSSQETAVPQSRQNLAPWARGLPHAAQATAGD